MHNFQGKESINELKKSFTNDPQYLDILLELTQSSDPKISWRSAWVFEHSIIENQEFIKKYTPTIVSLFPNLENDSIKRHFAKILTYSNTIAVANGDIINTCFNWMMIEKTPPAVKVHCMQILYNISTIHTDLQHELKLTIESMYDNSSAGFQSRAKKILFLLNKKRKL